MPENTQIVVPHGGYKNLIVYRKSDTVYEGTVLFCKRFLSAKTDRTVDQMIQAARSCKQNIAEGSSASGTSKETELKLTNVARATLDELMEDFRDYLKTHNYAEWPKDSKNAIFARNYSAKHNDWSDWKEFFETRSDETVANLMLTICNQTSYMLGRMIQHQESDFREHGGIRERMHAARTAARGEEFDKGIYSLLVSAKTAEELAAKTAEIKQKIEITAASIRRKKGWQ